MAEKDALPLKDENASDGAPPPVATPSIEDIAKATAGVLSKQLGTQLQQISARLEKLEAPPAEESVDEGEQNLTPQQREFAKFYGNPGEYIKAHSDAGVEPLLRPILDDKARSLHSTVKSEFDGEFGDGAFDEMIAEDLNTVLESMPEHLRSSEEHYRMAINGLKGRRFGELLERRDTTMKKQEEDERNGASLLGDSRPRPAGNPNTISDDEKELIAKWATHTGEKLDPKDYLRDKCAGIDEDSFPVEEQKND
jgi:hypothetical protein